MERRKNATGMGPRGNKNNTEKRDQKIRNNYKIMATQMHTKLLNERKDTV